MTAPYSGDQQPYQHPPHGVAQSLVLLMLIGVAGLITLGIVFGKHAEI